jgi:exonuclease III
MKLITLNIWGGIIHKPLLEFIKKYSDDIDIFCFQEVLFGSTPDFTDTHKGRINIFDEISSILSEFNGYKRTTEAEHFQTEPIEFKAGQAIFVRKNISVKENGDFYCYDKWSETSPHGGKLTGSLQWINIESGKEKYIIANLHGIWQQGIGKIDTPERFTQSKKIKDFFVTKEGKKIICGDFNLDPNGESIKILEEGMRNLIKEYKIQSTRSNFYKKDNKFADYILVSSDIKVEDFKVLPDEVSDHLPLLLEIK